MRAVREWLDRLVAFLDPRAGIRRRHARSVLETLRKPQREPPRERPRARSFGLWWEHRMVARRGWDV